ncbi:FKBP-type peptidyl-prolyl cis-trans isomerase SlyD [Bathymodiolus platifrons methanotrophic gill symbiont]|uniref:FKBP-type peptidyl-prolyl cis-trans isomerase n=1 Tax=Bathymodiolus platifrons methanotrophic gill symbiont TaxID=113268 RepID=UPI000B41450B|nr:peptidylprolyl isomerase [Bathymodiolus platifrons methanotrophic gill symbiont]MCK5869894.1 peptidylprolyl isomerase [Methyloprofundus sp.]TXK95590.1 peptidylprolyl isomerase [Methylococcaceae bacterium CS4]TXK96716.1 peptidylprolyl isomerase [Methylococcaceae bacterium CS5]TXK98295.1 peptidylprolyl isomerase [Methylococcaceae bacterium HT1]TXL06971.1 peptidylprolyl isomerase [Methylococcaceae bacterium CS3]TXL07154.1 peptidylprolyl isomerase [Methylococcaceae bacterium CS1]TXL10691.1 pe
MKNTENPVVSIHYTLTNKAGEKLDSSIGAEPLSYLHGAGNIIPGLESALSDASVGDKLTVTIEPADAYGEHNEQQIQTVAKDMFKGMDKVEVGMQFQADSSTGPAIVTITKIEGDNITIDGNHPLAGEQLTFDVEVMEIRSATETEMEHGHIHGAGCNHE